MHACAHSIYLRINPLVGSWYVEPRGENVYFHFVFILIEAKVLIFDA